jgi:hypothetical protein
MLYSWPKLDPHMHTCRMAAGCRNDAGRSMRVFVLAASAQCQYAHLGVPTHISVIHPWLPEL